MKKIWQSAVLSIVFGAHATPVGAEDSPFAVAAAARSMKAGFNARSGDVLERVARHGVEIAQGLGARLSAARGAVPLTSAANGNLIAVAGKWVLRVSGDGTWARGVIEHDLSGGTSSRIAHKDLETMGRDFIATHLGNVVTLRAGEELAILRTMWQTKEGQSSAGVSAPPLVVGHRAVFGRVINGRRVLGGGSTVVVTFSDAGVPVEFEADWPDYRVTSTTATTDVTKILERVRDVVAARTGSKRATNAVATTASLPSLIMPSASLTRLECGYYDRGVMAGGSSIVSPACEYEVEHAHAVGGGLMRSGLHGAVPATQAVRVDSAWPETKLLAGSSTDAAASSAATR